MLNAVLDALGELRSPFAFYENDLHEQVAGRLHDAGIACVHEAKLGSGCRIDFLAGSIGIEIKKGRPDGKQLAKQLARYASFEAISAIIVISERNVTLPKSVLGKPVQLVVLNHLWGVALP